jgi:hypothetical protein
VECRSPEFPCCPSSRSCCWLGLYWALWGYGSGIASAEPEAPAKAIIPSAVLARMAATHVPHRGSHGTQRSPDLPLRHAEADGPSPRRMRPGPRSGPGDRRKARKAGPNGWSRGFIPFVESAWPSPPARALPGVRPVAQPGECHEPYPHPSQRVSPVPQPEFGAGHRSSRGPRSGPRS